MSSSIMNLDKYKKDILSFKSKVTSSGCKYNAQTWSKLTPPQKKVVADFIEKTITRAHVIKAYEDYYKNDTNVLRPFLLTMIWGFSDTGYGTYRTKKYIDNKDNLKLIKESLDAVKLKDIETAFATLKKIKGLGVSYISKVLYFASKAAKLEEYVLIFDIRVARSLININTHKDIAELVNIYPSDKYEDYSKYNKLMRALAKKYKVDTDVIELFLFDLNKNDDQ